MNRNSVGFTLIEVIVSVSILTLIAGVDVLLLETGMDAWNYASARINLQEASDDLISTIFEGGFNGGGIRDAIDVKEGGVVSIRFVPLWIDTSHHPDAVRNREQKFILERQFKPGAATPIAEVKLPGADDFRTVPIKFFYGPSRDPKAPDDVLQFLDPIPPESQIKILYTPDGESDPEVIKVFRWDPASQHVYESYAGKTKDILQHSDSVKIERFAFLYFDNLNRLVPLGGGDVLSSLGLRRAKAVKLYMLLRRGNEWKEETSFTNIRNVETIGATIAEGSELPMPSHYKIKAFSIGDFYGMKKDGIVELLVRTNTHKGWKVRLVFKKAPKSDDLVLQKFQMEAPPGKILTSGILNQTIAKNEFVNILTLDRTGLYDYGQDEGVSGELVISGRNPTVTVMRLDFEGASLFIRP